MSEQEYDEIVAPMLHDVAERCRELGMTLIARVEWEPDSYGITQVVPEDAGIGQKMTQLAAHCRGNIDLFCMEAMKRFDCSQSAVLFRFGKTDA
jgi:hypothetical protein